MHMLPETEMLQYIYKTADMGVSGIDAVLKRLEESPVKEALEGQRKDYERIGREARRLLERQGAEVTQAGGAAKASAHWMAAGKLALDHSPSKVAEMTIQGTTMGITKTLKHLHDNPDGGEAVELGQQLLALQESGVEQMKAYL